MSCKEQNGLISQHVKLLQCFEIFSQGLQGMEVFLGYVIENPSRVIVSVASLGIAVFAALLRGMHAVFASLLAIFGSFLAMML